MDEINNKAEIEKHKLIQQVSEEKEREITELNENIEN